MTVLAAMAHEYGHVQWAIATIRRPGDPDSDPSGLQNCSTGDFFRYWAYSNTRQLRPPGHWRNFKSRETAGGAVDHLYRPTLADFENQNLTADEKNYLFLILYQSDKPWASYFASLTPDEDFVESYVFQVLTGAQPALRSLPVTITYSDWSTHTVDIPRDFFSAQGKPALTSRISCLPQ